MKLRLEYGKCSMCGSTGATVVNTEPEVGMTEVQKHDSPAYWHKLDRRPTPSPLCFSCVEAFDHGEEQWA